MLELTQIKQGIIDHYRELFASHNNMQYSDIQQDIEQAINTISFKIEIAPSILHLSDDVYKDITIHKVINLWKYLYQHYIDESSNSSINISHSVRLSIKSYIDKHHLLTDKRNTMMIRTKLTKKMDNIHESITQKNENENTLNPNNPNPDYPKKMVLAPVESTASSSSRSGSGSMGEYEQNMKSVELQRGNTEVTKSKLEWHNTIMELIGAFDCAAKEVYTLLETDSWGRFKVSTEFKTWKQQCFDQPQKRKFTLS